MFLLPLRAGTTGETHHRSNRLVEGNTRYRRSRVSSNAWCGTARLSISATMCSFQEQVTFAGTLR